MLELEEERTSPTIIRVVGVGGAGMNAVNRMIDADLRGVDFIVINTDEQVLKKSAAEERIAIGQKTTRGMGAGGDPDIGFKAAMEDRDRILQALKGSDMVFITAGMGGGTGTGAAPIVAEVAREMGALTVGVVTLPFAMEGGKRMNLALRGMEALREKVDTLITIRNDSIFKVIDRVTPVDVAFRLVDEILLNAVKGISDLINTAGVVNVDFADVRAIMGETGDAIMGAGEGVGDNRVSDAVNQAINNALLEETSIEGATALLINVCGGEDMSITEWKDVSELITQHVDPQANIIIGLTVDKSLRERLRVTVIATGFRRAHNRNQSESRRQSARQRLPRAGGDGGQTTWTSYGDPEGGQFDESIDARTRPGRRAEAAGNPAPVVNIRQTERSARIGPSASSDGMRDRGGAAMARRENDPGAGRVSGLRSGQNKRPMREDVSFKTDEPEDDLELEDALDADIPALTPREELQRPAERNRFDPDDLEIPAYLRRRPRQ
ncbi:MAG: cell division protein FtsZ [Leptospiraceae bacterium]|nr:cell division protein FtsZ [Leptospiraceae bacterium]